MLNLNGKKYAANNNEMEESVFHLPTCSGYYKRVTGGVQILDLKRKLIALVVYRPASPFFVSATTQSNGRPWYSGAAALSTERELGIYGMSEREQEAIAKDICTQAGF